ncbi:MAG TPA: tRNA (N6-threonylcarbamoyladenosine(37)-N6)-methyltransferase TrmO [Fibrobacteraceae bacterium]|nr:tRNA (N6-threonylcarbamoyladenosine(37)-N6)-methyltransferase TrmO [Fibrobacteraceae bacterium]
MNQEWSEKLCAIGVVHSPFHEATGTPVQPFAAAQYEGGCADVRDYPEAPRVSAQGSQGTLEIFPEWEEALLDLEGFSRAWILFWCHRSAEPKKHSIPYRDAVPHGLFATRAPARPNPIGISTVRIQAVRGRFIHVSEMDALHGSPLLDLKPYVPLYDSYPDERAGWLEHHPGKKRAVKADARFEREKTAD